jgi:hypothetical protein
MGSAVKQNSGPDPFEASDAKTVLTYLKSKKLKGIVNKDF